MAEAWKSAPAVTEAPKAAWQSAPAVRRDSFGDGVEGVMDGLAEAIKAIPDALRHPLDSAYQMFEASKDQYEKAVKAAGPGRDNKGDVAGFIQHALGMFPVLGPMGSNLLDAVDSGADSYEVGKRAGNLLSLKLVPEITKKGIALAGKAVDVAPSVGPALKAGVKAAGPDVAAGAAKAAGGMAVGELLPIPVVKHLVALEMSRPGLRQAGRGLVKGFNAARESFSPTTEAVSPQLDAFAVRAGFPDFASAPLEIKPLLQNAFEAEVDRLAQTPPKVDPGPAGVTPSGPVRQPVATAAQMMREAETFRPPETFVPGGPLRPPVRPAPAAPAEMPALEQITEWLANRDGGTASRFTDPVVSEAPITKQTLGDIMDRLMKNRKVPAEVPAATVPAEVPPAAVETPQPATPAEVPAVKATAAKSLAELLRDEMLANGSITEAQLSVPEASAPVTPEGRLAIRDMMRDLPKKAGKAIAKSNYAGNQDPQVAKVVFEEGMRGEKVKALADALRKGGYDKPEIVDAMKPEHWEFMAKKAGVNPPGSDITITEIKRNLFGEAKPKPKPRSPRKGKTIGSIMADKGQMKV